MAAVGSVFADVAAVRGAAARLRLRSIVGAVVASLSSKIVDAAAARGAAARLQLRPLREVFDRHRQLLEVFGRRLLLLARWIAAERWLALSAKRAEPLGHYLRRMKESAYSSRSA